RYALRVAALFTYSRQRFVSASLLASTGPVPGLVPVQVAGPVGASLPATEPIVRLLAKRLHHIVLNLSMPGDHIGRAATAPASVDERIALVDVEASHFRRPFLATEDAGAVLLPIDDMSQRILDGPGIL